MSRRHRAEKREILPDAKFGDRVVTKFMNNLMYAGKKSVAESIVYGAFGRVEEKLKRESVEYRVVERERRGAVLTRPALPCLYPYHTLNITTGCPNACVYCYAQSYDHHPGWGTVVFYSNALEKLTRDLPRMRRKPTMVYLSTASEDRC